jgi:CRISPR-associated protein Cmr3
MPDTITLQLEALDTLFFKDGKPFSLGEETWADGIFPPPPSVLYGALRTAIISGELGDQNLSNLIEQTDSLSLTHFSTRLQGGGQDEYYPLPLDVVERKDKDYESGEYEVFPLEVKEVDTVSNSEHQVLPFYEADDNETVETVSGGLISRSNLVRYLKGNTQPFVCRKWDDYKIAEPKIGIKRDRATRSTGDESGALYRVGLQRTEGVQFQVGFSLPNFKLNNGLIRLGAEGKVAKARQPDDGFDWKGPSNLTTRYIKVYLTTPGLFKGQGPDLTQLGIEAELKGMAIGKPFSLGGFDMSQGRPKPMLKVIPAGSVFYYEASQPVELAPFHGKALAETINGIDYARQGFGIAYFGTWKKD